MSYLSVLKRFFHRGTTKEELLNQQSAQIEEMRRKHEAELLATDNATQDVNDDGEEQLTNENSEVVGFVAALKQVSNGVESSVCVF